MLYRYDERHRKHRAVALFIIDSKRSSSPENALPSVGERRGTWLVGMLVSVDH